MQILASFARVYVSDLEGAIALFRRSADEQPRLRFAHGSGLELALVGDVLILAGPDAMLEPFRATQVTLIVDDLDQALAGARGRGGTIVRGPAEQPTGRNATVAEVGGAVVEYLQWTRELLDQLGM